MAHANHSMNIAAGVEISLQLHPDRFRCGNKIVKNAIGHLFVGDGAVAVAVHIQLDCLEFHHARAWLVDQPQHCEIRITREGAFAGEFGQLDRHLVRSTRARVVEADQFRYFNGPLPVERGLGLLISL